MPNNDISKHTNTLTMQQSSISFTNVVMEGLMNEAIAEHSRVYPLQLPLCKCLYSRDMEGPVNEATVEHPIVQTLQLQGKCFHSRDMEGPVNEATAVPPTVHL